MITIIFIFIYLIIGLIVFLYNEKDTEFIKTLELLTFVIMWPVFYLSLLFDFIANNFNKLSKFKNPFYKNKKNDIYTRTI